MTTDDPHQADRSQVALPEHRMPQPGPTQDLFELRIHQAATLAEIRGRARQLETARRLTERQTRLVPSSEFGYPTTEQAMDLHERLGSRLRTEIAAGATVHQRVPRLLRYLPWAVALLDGLILYTFCADIFNVRPREVSPNGLAAIALAVLGSAIAYAWLSLTGSRLRDHRNHLGGIEWRLTDPSTRIMVGVGLVVSATLGVLMYQRVVDKAALAGEAYISPDQVGVLGWVFAVLSVCANFTVVAVHALDGSALAASLRGIGRAVRRDDVRRSFARRRAFRRALAMRPAVQPLDGAAGPLPEDDHPG
jgi:hypothetical protein